MRKRSRPHVVPPGHRTLVGAPHEIIGIARRWLGRAPAVHYRPDIPALKEAVARDVHAAHLPDAEALLVLYDATLLQTGEDGFVVTTERLCWKNLFDHPCQLAWSELDPASIVTDIGNVGMTGGTLAVSSGLTSQVAGFLTEMATRCRPAPGGRDT